jgi:hypothetical protein
LTFEQIFQSRRLFRLTFVRNPYTRALSCYLEKIVANESERLWHQRLLGFSQQEPVTFREFLQGVDRISERDRDPHWRTQAALLKDQQIRFDYIGRFENLDHDFSNILGQLGIRDPAARLQNVDHHKTNARSRLQEFYGPAEIALARKVYQMDFLRYGYSFDLPTL